MPAEMNVATVTSIVATAIVTAIISATSEPTKNIDTAQNFEKLTAEARCLLFDAEKCRLAGFGINIVTRTYRLLIVSIRIKRKTNTRAKSRGNWKPASAGESNHLYRTRQSKGMNLKQRPLVKQ